jgi:hypothetical protein
MSNIFTWESQDIDLKEYIKLKTNCQQNDTMVLQFNVYDYDIPVDLTNFNVSFVAKKPDGTIYGQVENIVKTNNLLKITCNEQLTSITGRVIGTLVITDNNGNRKGSYFIVLNVFGIVNDDDRIVSKNFVDVLNRFDEDVAIALSLSNKFEQDINTAQIISDDFAEKIPLAQSTDNTLNNTIDEANSINNTLTNTNSTANTLENKLTSHIETGTNLKNDLLLNISTAGQKNDELTLTVESADNKLQEFKNYDTTQLVPLSNTMLNEMHCNKELLSLNHGLNGYPIAKMTYTEFGGGVGGAGDFPSGADSDCNLMQNKVIYHDSNNMTIFVPQNYYITNPTVNKINDYKYTVTFTNSTRSILIELIEGDIQNQVNDNTNNVNEINSDLNQINTKLDDTIYQIASGTATTITLTIKSTLVNGYPITFIASANNGGAITTINGKKLYKPSTTISPVLIKDKAYTVWYNSTGDCFFIKASATGNTIASHVLAGDTFSTDVDNDLIGTMPNNGALNYTMPINGSFTIPLGYTTGGTITQNITTKSEQTYQPSTSQQIINSGRYLSGDQTIAPVTGNTTINDVILGKVFSSANGINLVGQATIQSLGGAQIQTGSIAAPTAIDPSTTTHIQTSFSANGIIMIDKYGARGCYVLPSIGASGYWDASSTSGEQYSNSGSSGITFNGTDITWYTQSNDIWYTPVTWIAFKF